MKKNMPKNYGEDVLCEYIEYLYTLCKRNIETYSIYYNAGKVLEHEKSKIQYHFFSKTNHVERSCTILIGIINYIHDHYKRYFKTSSYKKSIFELINELCEDIKNITGKNVNKNYNENTCETYVKRDLSTTPEIYKLLHENDAFILNSIIEGMRSCKSMRKKRLTEFM